MIKKKQHYKEDRGDTKNVNNISVINPISKENESNSVQDSEIIIYNRGRQLNTKKDIVKAKNLANATCSAQANSNYNKSILS